MEFLSFPNFLGGNKCSCHYNVWGGETNFFMHSKRRHFIEQPPYDVDRIP